MRMPNAGTRTTTAPVEEFIARFNQVLVADPIPPSVSPPIRIDLYEHGFSWRNRIGRLLWKVVEATLFRFSPPSAHAYRRYLLKSFGATIAKGALVYPTARIWAPWNLTMEQGSCISWGVECYSVATIRLGERALVSQHARLIAASHDITDPAFPMICSPIDVGQEAWICAYAYVGMGRTVGSRAVVAATATVTRDVPPDTVVGGNPAKKIGMRTVRREEP